MAYNYVFLKEAKAELAEKGYRAVLLGSYIMLYTFEDETVYIAHIFHQRQDYAQLV